MMRRTRSGGLSSSRIRRRPRGSVPAARERQGPQQTSGPGIRCVIAAGGQRRKMVLHSGVRRVGFRHESPPSTQRDRTAPAARRGSGSRPMKRRYSSAGSSLSPFDRMFSRNAAPTSRLKMPLVAESREGVGVQHLGPLVRVVARAVAHRAARTGA